MQPGPTPPDPPRFDLSLEPPAARNRLGWYLVILLSSFIVIVQLATYLQRPKREAFQTTGAEIALRLVAVQETLLAMADPAPNRQKAAPAMLRPTLEALRDDAGRHRDPAAARVYAVASRELGMPIPRERLQPLLASGNPDDRLFAAFYLGETRLPAEELARRLGRDGIVGRYAAAHAREQALGRRLPPAERGVVSQQQAAVWMLVVFAGGAVFLLSLALWGVYLVARSKGALRPLGPPLHAGSAALSDHLALRAGLMFVVFLGSDALFSFLPGEGLGPGAFARGALLVAAAVLIAALPLQGRSLGLRRIGVDARRLGPNLLWGLGAAVANIPVLVFAVLFGQFLFPNLPAPEHPITNEIAKGGWAVAAAVLFLGAVVAPIVEEIWFRGLLLPAMVRSMGGVFGGVFFSSLLFAMVHPTGVPAWPALAAIGAMAALLTFQTRSLVPSIVMHAVHNGTLLALNLLLFAG
ncbi:MAG: CPBP family intramembrane metalloprotease [Fimbriimonadales bacterium]|nr:CPBP family intramembrane metalloprotease [Fimbriimonadales bacterium]